MAEARQKLALSKAPADPPKRQSSEPVKLEWPRRERVYPPAGATHKEVVADAQLFSKTLSKFTSDMGSELVIPRVSGKEFDAHRLYCSVTELGGLEKVTRENRWRDIAAAFDLPRTVTRPVYFLRMHYTKLLHHYEQVYYHGKRGLPVPPPDALPKPLPALPDQNDLHFQPLALKTEFDSENHRDEERKALQLGPVKQYNTDSKPDHGDACHSQALEQKRPGHSPAPEENPSLPVGQKVTGSIDGKFEHGYFVTVVVGSEKLRGVIYRVPDNQEFEAATPEEAEVKPVTPARRKRKQDDAPGGVKTARTPYNFFVAEQRQKMIGIPRNQKSRLIGDMWNGLSEMDRLPYFVLAKSDKERYEKEKLERNTEKKQ